MPSRSQPQGRENGKVANEQMGRTLAQLLAAMNEGTNLSLERGMFAGASPMIGMKCGNDANLVFISETVGASHCSHGTSK